MYYFFNNFSSIGKKRDRSVVAVIESRFVFENWNYFCNLLNNSQRGTNIIPFILFKTLRDKLLGPVLLFSFSVSIMSLIASTIVGDKIKLFGFRVLRSFLKLFLVGGMLSCISLPTEVKKLLKCSAYLVGGLYFSANY